MQKVMGMITMNAHAYTLDIIKHSWDAFDRFVIIDGNLSEEVVKKYRDLQFELFKERIDPNAQDNIMGDFGVVKVDNNDWSERRNKLLVVNRSWNNNFAGAYQTYLDCTEEGDWILMMDSDEFPSQLLMDNLDKIIEDSDNGRNFDIAMLPVVDFLDGEKLWNDDEVPQTYQPGMWVKYIFVRRGKNPIQLVYSGTSESNCHAIAQGTKYAYYCYPYYHKKNTLDFVKNELWEMFLTPEGQRLSNLECARFVQACKIMKINSSQEFMQRIEEGTIGPILEKMAIEYREKMIGEQGDLHPLCQLFCYYFLVCDNGRSPNMVDSRVKEWNNKEWYFNYIQNWKKRNLTYRKYRRT